MFYYLDPEVAGELGANTVMDLSQHPPSVSHLHYNFTGWLGDDLLESFPCYIITRQLCDAIAQNDLTGYRFEAVEISKSSQFEELYPDKQIPEFIWLKPVGVGGEDDFGRAKDHRIVVSEKALRLLRTFCIKNCDVEKFDKD